MDTAKMNQAIRIAKLYYELHYNQLEIAAREGISKSSVSRILKNAMDMGIIEVRIKDSVLADSSLENELIERFPIKRAIIMPDLVGNPPVNCMTETPFLFIFGSCCANTASACPQVTPITLSFFM